ncbi:subtilisin family serine protease [Catenuloplanes nepalensis]|uniref:Subtilisin family serine protease n=1 Tax=Catenuloplanes nepalensis TaxID=587533 RepID=A0ABT9N2V9_9ACTN|nr:S8 family serine peptidase [Catenuloplanes nepalensis]MDP9798024.1 subtilisin family serine protease [Catenuloplanes nepalensis]
MTAFHRTGRRTTGLAIASATAAAFVALSGVGVAQAAAPVTGAVLQDGAPGAIKDSYIVVLRDGAATGRSANVAGDLAKRYGGKVRASFGSAVRGFTAEMSRTAARRLAADPAVKLVEQDRRVTMSATQSNPTWGLDRVDQRDLPLNRSYTSPAASNVTAYVMDTGVRISHKDFGGRARHGWDFVDNDAVADDCQGHGTHVAGTVGGAAYGVAKDVKLVSVRVLGCDGSGSYSQIIAGVDWVTRNAVKPAVVNMSLGGSTSASLDDAVQRSINSGVTYVLAAGNENKDACASSPARLPAGITVGASDSNDARASFSNWGSCLDIFAPGAKILSDARTGDTSTTTMSGTSMAAPHVAGAAALVLGANPQATPQQVRDALVGAATPGKVTGVNGSPNRLLYTGTATAPLAVQTPVTPAAASCDRFESLTDVALPATSALTVASCGTTGTTASKKTSVQVNVRQPVRGDLRIQLTSPNGKIWNLKAAAGTGDLNTAWNFDASTALKNGKWTLTVKDAQGRTGLLDSWTLTV